jgi:nitroreductase
MSQQRSTVARIEDPEQVEAERGPVRRIAEVPAGAEWNAVEQAILRRRSIRAYRKRQVPAHLVRRVLEMGRFAPSQGNCQPWKFVVVRDAATIQEMERFCVEACKKLVERIDYTVQPRGSLRRFATRAMTRTLERWQPNALHPVPMAVARLIAEGRFAVFHRAPTVILLLMDRRGIGEPLVDIGICGTNVVLAAQSLGLGTCWVGFAKLLQQSAEWRERLGVEDPYELGEAITVGYPVGDPTHPIARDTHEIAWIEGGKTEVVY